MLSPEIIKKIKKVHIRSGYLVSSMMAGQYRSVFRGTGIEFEDVREYSPGDDIKSIDWKVSARLGRPFIKRYREERELIVMLLVDMSASGYFGTVESVKNEIAAEIASILAFNAIRNNDKVGAILFTDRIEKYIPPKKGSAHVWRLIRDMFTFTPEHRGTDIGQAATYLGRVCRKRTVTFLISDFLCSDTDSLYPIKIISRKHELIAVMLSDPKDFELPDSGILCAEDLETGDRKYFDAYDESTHLQYKKQRTQEYQKNLEALRSADIDRIEVSTADSAADALIRYFRLREKRKKS